MLYKSFIMKFKETPQMIENAVEDPGHFLNSGKANCNIVNTVHVYMQPKHLGLINIFVIIINLNRHVHVHMSVVYI